jgi:CopG family nickel-responsive transcriptional regulator
MPVVRIGVSLEPELLRELDRITEAGGYANRSQAIRDLIRTALIRQMWGNEEANVLATITVLYETGVRDVTRRLQERQHDFLHEIKSSTHVHLSEDHCIEVLVAEGKAKELARLANALRGVRGVLHADAVLASADLP